MGGWARSQGRGPRRRFPRRRRRAEEFRRINALTGKEPVLPELSGMRVRYPSGVPRHISRLLIQLGYRWQPSKDYEQRQAHIRDTNRWLRYRRGEVRALPPILSYQEDTDVVATRFQPMPNQARLPIEDLSDLEHAERLRSARMLHPPLQGPDTEYLVGSRALFPRQYRHFLRHSPYPRVAVTLVAGMAAVLGMLWINDVQHTEALAASRLHVARHAFQSAVNQAQAYGVDPHRLHLLEARARMLDGRSAPSALPVSRTRVHFYREQEQAYRSLVRTLHGIEHRALFYWRWRESRAYGALTAATRAANAQGLRAALPPLPACTTPRCYRAVVARQDTRAAWLRQTAGTLRVYASVVATSQDPAGAARTELQAARSLHALLPDWVARPARIANLDGMYATAAGSTDYARVGALAHLDVDVLRTDLVKLLPGHAIVVSVEDQTLSCYQHGRVVCHTPVTATSSTPTGVFHIQVKQATIPTVYWSPAGGYRDGALLDWMAFSGSTALQGAPWRSVFGPGSDAALPAYAPATPGSVDLPPTAAGFLFRWASMGTEVVLY